MVCAIDVQETALERDPVAGQSHDPLDLPSHVHVSGRANDGNVSTAWASSQSCDQKHVSIEQRRLHAGASDYVQLGEKSQVRQAATSMEYLW